jgi:peptidoglycan hydrolase-like protein with peptidoglycan-binding domain
MKSLHYILLVSLLSAAATSAQTSTSSRAGSVSPTAIAESKASGTRRSGTAKRGPVFRANKDQIVAAQTMLRTKGLYAGDANGKLDPATRASIKSFQKANGLAATGTLNRATLEKMSIELTEKQKAIPVSQGSYASVDKPKRGSSSGDRPARTIFRATKEQIMEAQRLLRSGGLYSGEESGKLDDPTREGLKKYQEANGLKATGTLNQSTLEKMGIALSERQKAGAP